MQIGTEAAWFGIGVPPPSQKTLGVGISENYSFGNTIPVCFWYFPDLSL